MTHLEVGMFQTLAVAVVSIYFGDFMLKRFSIFRRYCIPSPVVGGTIFAIVTTILFSTGVLSFKFDYTVMNSFFYNVFFAATGMGASLSFIKKGGKLIIIFAILAALLAFLQNVLALGVGTFMGMNPLVALMAGSVPLTGGHGNAASFGPLAESMGGTGALEVAIAAATFGLIAGCIMGGPLGNRLVQKYGLNKTSTAIKEDGGTNNTIKALVNSKRAHHAVFILLLACGIGQSLFLLSKILLPGINLPIHVMSMFGGIILRLILDTIRGDHNELYQSIDIVGNISLSIFVSLSIVTMKLWQLAELALPLMTILVLQLVLVWLFCYYITFRACGKNYDSAIISVGHSGFGLGAVPVSMATMTAVCNRYHYSHIAFFVVPVIGGFVSNITNAVIITGFLNIAQDML
ncbi:sodium:glutamate symporter [Helicobacter sp. 13S00401-1]|uniref:sodium/glutamate symporter n=1 Tax=Helicobacter sp. 13S00401-1 TaxID=1905758 RepID=UPI000BA5BD7B|nr:sodium/glutamate symporter [Helicobacter sp. 13S00401-1]PAF47721.1 sodium:glutamate symporter [Helicobacter sp. 13S00401-1]